MDETTHGPTGDVESADELERFWLLARSHARFSSIPGYFGPTTLEVLMPPTFSLGDAPAQADAAVARLLADEGATLTSPAPEPGGELPQVGELGIVLDGAGHPRALVATEAVDVVDGSVHERLALIFGE